MSLYMIRARLQCLGIPTRFFKGNHSAYSSKKDCASLQSFIPFMKLLENRREQANRSILVQVQSADSYKELYSYCSTLGIVKDMFHYREGTDPSHFILIEFEEQSHTNNVLRESTYLIDGQTIPTSSHFLWFRAANRKSPKLKQNKSACLLITNGTAMIKDDKLYEALSKCETISEEMEKLHELTKLNEMGSRLRFLTARQVEGLMSGLFPKARAYPFGSSVNGFGKMGCDLDLILRLTDEKEKEHSRLVYHCKASSSSERSANQKNMEVIGDLIYLFLPGCTQVRRILQARVPIIKYHHQLTDIECDLSMTNMSGVYMSDLLYMFGEMDYRVRPLIFTIRRWAKEVGLTNSSPGRWITNFTLTLLVLAYLQNPPNSHPVLPSLNSLVRSAGPEDAFVTEDGTDCTFARDLRKLTFAKSNVGSLEQLLVGFFEYYCHFDFNSMAVCLNEAVHLTKPDHSPMYVVNPLEKGLNVSKNVSHEEVERFKCEVKNAAWVLESQNDGRLTGLFESGRRKPLSRINFTESTKSKRLMNVTTLFKEAEDEEQTEEYKNDTMASQVKSIRKETKERIKMLEAAMGQKSRR
ncbi:poly(A) RNA polymerase, mitochondrial [Cylas formicarius]|uniref:poly(A) RNA polymerase, mitochondrial n=1 Tax=Cylas formicarius TaxID=197179 RepID=UPI002958D49B|nr:poly(A) RNA polymerase, mitochondrial [Cylas formicarius]